MKPEQRIGIKIRGKRTTRKTKKYLQGEGGTIIIATSSE